MSFPDYLTSKKIDATRFEAAEPDVFREWADVFEHVHPNSFTLQKLNLINAVRRKYGQGVHAPVAKSGAVLPGPVTTKPKIN